MEKITKRQMYTAMINYAENGSFSFETDEGTMVVAPDEIVTFAENEISLLDSRQGKGDCGQEEERERCSDGCYCSGSF